ncbi:N-acetyltransferase [Zoogloea sp. 1C4]|uniref:GNAT family N-acetyltransferase n=1 Tax=Zoogloea sp. 1C4 TaxID=2570190 RepID=UPI001290FEF3|nr:GNAT family N-acetyltransferase [Zoogloea sp. 1C4]
MTTLTLQPVNFDDPRQTADFLFLLDHYMRGPTGNGKPMDDDLRARLPDALRRRPTVLCHIAYVSDESGRTQPAGLINCVEGFSTFAGKPLLNIHDIVVHEDFRRRGIARALLAHAETVARDRGCCKLTLEVLEGNRGAHRAYLEFGFQAYQLDPAMGAAMFMEKKLG